MNGDMISNVFDAVAQGFFIAGTYKVLWTKKRSLGSVFSMDTVQEGGKLAVSSFVYGAVGQPLVSSVIGQVSSITGGSK